MDQYDFILFTDGSGYQDGFSGYCATAVCTVTHLEGSKTVMGALSGSSVARSEMTALLEGLQAILDMEAELPKYRINDRKINVHWITDREDLSKSIIGEYGRHKNKDLWARIAYYESIFNITPQWISRETEYPEFQACDLHASTLRLIIKNYIEQTK